MGFAGDPSAPLSFKGTNEKKTRIPAPLRAVPDSCSQAGRCLDAPASIGGFPDFVLASLLDVNSEVVRPEQDHAAAGQPLRGRHSNARVTPLYVRGIVFHPQGAVASSDEHDVSLGDVHTLPIQRALKIIGRDDIPRCEAYHTFVGDHIDENASGDNRTNFLDTEFRQAACRGECCPIESVVKEVAITYAHSDVTESIELRTNLAELAAHQRVEADGSIRSTENQCWRAEHR